MLARNPTPLWCLLALLAFPTAGCWARDGAEPPPPQVVHVQGGAAPAAAAAQSPDDEAPGRHFELELETYDFADVPTAERALGVLNAFFIEGTEGQSAPGRAVLGPSRTEVVVLATDALHAGLAEVAEQVRNAEAAPGPKTVEMTYWLITSAGAGGELADAFPPIRKALETITSRGGSETFELLEQVSVLSLEGKSARAESHRLSLEQHVWREGGTTVATIDLNTRRGGALDTHVRIADGQTLVLGQVGMTGRMLGDGERVAGELRATDAPVTLYVVVQTRVTDQSSNVEP